MVRLLFRFFDRVSLGVLFGRSMVESAGLVHQRSQILEVLAFISLGLTTVYGRTFRSSSLSLLGKERQRGDEGDSHLGCLVIVCQGNFMIAKVEDV